MLTRASPLVVRAQLEALEAVGVAGRRDTMRYSKEANVGDEDGTS